MATLDSAFTEALAYTLEKLDIKELKTKQMEAVKEFVKGRDVFVTLPTGYGKSIIYGILPVLFDKLKGRNGSLVVCVSPLTSIMIDQTKKFSQKGLTTNFIAEAQDDPEAVRMVLNGQSQLVFISPESLINNLLYRNMLLSGKYKEKLVALAIDEAHCVKTWGDSFRVAFAEIGTLRSLIPSNVFVLALTATATWETYKCVCDRLSLVSPSIIGLNPCRNNIFYSVKPFITLAELTSLLDDELRNQSIESKKTVVFCRRLKETAQLYVSLKNSLKEYFTFPSGFEDVQSNRLVDMYTKACRPEFKEKLIELFVQPNSTLRIVIATTAFGMGIDCPNIRRIIHWGTPSSLEQYAQETGRAGRDMLPAEAILYYRIKENHVDDSVHSYCNAEIYCRKLLLYRNFLFFNKCALDNIIEKCKCCDMCNLLCGCQLCKGFFNDIVM